MKDLRMKIFWKSLLIYCFTLLILLLSNTSGWSQTNQYHAYSDLETKLKQLADDYSKVIDLKSHGESLGGKEIWSVTLASGNASEKPALLMVAGGNGTDLAGTEVILNFIQSISQNYGKVDSITKMLDQTTFYIFPRVNPDASEAMFSKPQYARSLNNRPMDLDNDDKIDEDGYDDLNKDGQITWLRITEPGGEWFEDEKYPGLLKKADAGKGETGIYRLIREGFDNDGDGLLNEDEQGGVNFNQNFTFKYKFFTPGSGFHQISEVETRAVVDFAYAHPNIAAVFSFSPNDNLNHPWEAAKGPPENKSGRRNRKPIEQVEKKDVPYYSHISEKFKNITGFEDLPKSESGQGAFNEWAYYHFGRWSFSTPTWWPPKSGGVKDTTVSAPDSSKKELEKNNEKNLSKKPSSNSEKSMNQRLWDWLQTTNQKDAFGDWTEIKHPDYPDKKVEVGGFKPFEAENPPADSLASISKKYYPFLVRLSSWIPRIDVQNLKVEHLHNSVYRVTLNVVNQGFLPSNTQIGIRNKWCPKIKLAMDLTDKQQLVSGKVLQFIDTLDGSGGSEEISWMVMGKKGDTIKLSVGSPMTGTILKNVKLQ
jgi:hypothetical protein